MDHYIVQNHPLSAGRFWRCTGLPGKKNQPLDNGWFLIHLVLWVPNEQTVGTYS
jgi:hypothetical protein